MTNWLPNGEYILSFYFTDSVKNQMMKVILCQGTSTTKMLFGQNRRKKCKKGFFALASH